MFLVIDCWRLMIFCGFIQIAPNCSLHSPQGGTAYYHCGTQVLLFTSFTTKQKHTPRRGYKWLVRTLAVASDTSLMICSNRAVSSACRWVWRAIFSLNFLGFAMIAKHLLTTLRGSARDKTRCSGSRSVDIFVNAFFDLSMSLKFRPQVCHAKSHWIIPSKLGF
jgi:hypothetical protein